MKCPFRLMHQPYDGGSECDPECAWLVEVSECCAEPLKVCAVTLMGSPMDCPRKVLNKMEAE